MWLPSAVCMLTAFLVVPLLAEVIALPGPSWRVLLLSWRNYFPLSFNFFLRSSPFLPGQILVWSETLSLSQPGAQGYYTLWIIFTISTPMSWLNILNDARISECARRLVISFAMNTNPQSLSFRPSTCHPKTGKQIRLPTASSMAQAPLTLHCWCW